jgi:hypothetical protein
MDFPKNLGTAVLIFANSPIAELENKPFGKRGELFAALTDHTLNTVKKTGLPYFLITEKQQLGNSFGERFVHAMEGLFNKGYNSIITIGNDTPSLLPSQILAAHTHLAAGKSVLGPSKDGGFYLMGLHISNFKAQAFLDLPWCTTRLAPQLMSLLNLVGGPVVRLRSLLDLDTLEDLRFYICSTHAIKALAGIILQILFEQRRETISQKTVISLYHTFSHYNKGSPQAFML